MLDFCIHTFILADCYAKVKAFCSVKRNFVEFRQKAQNAGAKFSTEKRLPCCIYTHQMQTSAKKSHLSVESCEKCARVIDRIMDLVYNKI